MDMENRALEDELNLQKGHFPLPWLWEKEYFEMLFSDPCQWHSKK